MSDASVFVRSPEDERRYELIGSLVLVVLGLILFATSFLLQNPVPLTVRGAIVVFIAVSIAVAAGLLTGFPITASLLASFSTSFRCALRIILEVATGLLSALACDLALLVVIHRCKAAA